MEVAEIVQSDRFQSGRPRATLNQVSTGRASLDGAEKPIAYHAKLLLEVRDAQDKTAFAELFSYFAPRVKSFLMKGGADIGLAEECAQEVMVTVWRKAHLYDPLRATASTWIFTIARNKRIDALRKRNRPEPEELYWMEDSEPDTAEIVGMQQEADKLASAVEELPEKQREVLKRAFYGDLSHQEIADETGLPLGTIKSRIRCALEKLRHGMA